MVIVALRHHVANLLKSLAMDNRLERYLETQQKQIRLMGDRIERIEHIAAAPFRTDDD